MSPLYFRRGYAAVAASFLACVLAAPSNNASGSRGPDVSISSAPNSCVPPGALNAVPWTVADGGNGHYYEFVEVDEGITWDDAEAAAEIKGGHLATISSADENEFVRGLTNDRDPWIGGYQLDGSEEPGGGWTWVTEEPFDYTNWFDGEPNNFNGEESRLELHSNDGTWNDLPPVNQLIAYVIEYENPVSNGLVGWWPGDGRTIDVINGNNGTLKSSATFSSGVVDEAFSLNGDGDYVEIPDNDALDVSTAITLDAWVNCADVANGGAVVTKYDSSTSGLSYALAINGGGTIQMFVSQDGSGNGVYRYAITDGAVVSDDAWTHIAGTFNSATQDIHIYVNGAEVPSTIGVESGSVSSIYNSSTPVRIGALVVSGTTTGLAAFFNGRIDEVQIFSRALTSNEIQAIYGAGSAGQCKPAPSLGDYTDTEVSLAAQAAVIPSASPVNASKIDIFTSPDFKGQLQGDPVNGIVRITNANPAGVYTINVRAHDGNATVTKQFQLTVTTPETCTPVVFAPPTNYIAGERPNYIEVGDFNGDGNQDLVVAHYYEHFISIFLGNGSGGFNGPYNLDTNGYSGRPFVGDVDGDGDEDIIVETQDGRIALFIGDGNGGFTGATFIPFSAPQVSPLALADFNDDGKLDLLTTVWDSASVEVYFGDGNGNFSFGRSTPVEQTGKVAVDDFNGDGNLDIAMLPYDGQLSILLGSGDGTFTLSEIYFVGGDQAFFLVTGDFNGDGVADIAATHVSDFYSLAVLLGNGDGTFGDAKPIRSFAFSVTTGDFNGDGKLDLLGVNGDVQILLNDGEGNFSEARFLKTSQYGAWIGAVGDFNGDGKQDLAITTGNGPGDGDIEIFHRICQTAADYNGHRYLLTQNRESWTDAEAEAQSLGGHLVTINDSNEQEFLVATFMSGGPLADRPMWIGFNDAASEGNFVWSSGQSVSYTNWNPGEPNNAGDNPDGGEDYGCINWHFAEGSTADHTTWNDAPNNGTIGHPGTTDGPYFGIIEIQLPTFYRDADSDGYGDPNDTINSALQPDGYVTNGDDCDDTNAGVNPNADEICDGIDNNCNGSVDEGCEFESPTPTPTPEETPTPTPTPEPTATPTPTPAPTPNLISGTLYGADGAGGNSSNLYILDPSNGSIIQNIGPIGYSVTGLVFDPVTHVLYGSVGRESGPSTSSLIIIDPTTGAGTLVGAYNVSGNTMADLTITSDGTMYGWAEPGLDDLHTVNKSTGAGTSVGESGLDTHGSGLAANSNDLLYYAGNDTNGPLRVVDRNTGLTTDVVTLNGVASAPINALAFDAQDNLYGIIRGGDLVTINTSTGTIVDLGPTVRNMDAIAFVPGPAPPPPTEGCFNGHRYVRTKTPMSWTEAEAAAEAMGGYLAAVNDADEQTFLQNTFLQNEFADRPLWIGLNDEEVDGTFVWASSEPVTYTNWDSGEPNNGAGSGEDYVAMNWAFALGATETQGTWNDTPNGGTVGENNCDGLYYGIIEIPCVLPPDNLVSWWSGDGNANESNGGNNGAASEGVTFVDGEVAQAFHFNGDNSYVEIPDSTSLSVTGEITIDAWINPDDVSSAQGIVTKYDTCTKPEGSSYYLALMPGGAIEFAVYGTEAGAYRAVQTSQHVTAGKFTHVAATFDPATQTMKIYLNGVAAFAPLISGSSEISALLDSSTPVDIGRTYCAQTYEGSGEYFSGSIDEVQIFNRALTADEIMSIFHAGCAGQCKSGNDVSSVFVDKDYTWQQSGVADPVPAPSPFQLTAAVEASAPGRITSANFVPPGGSTTPMADDGNGNFVFDSARFASLSDFNTSFPNGNYDFNIDAIHSDGAFTLTVSITGDAYPNTPKILNTNWVGNSLQIDPTQDFTFNWNEFTGFDSSTIQLRIEDSSHNAVFDQFFFSPITSFTLPANTLDPNKIYKANLSFANVQDVVTSIQQRASADATEVSGQYATHNKFLINTYADGPVSSLYVTAGQQGFVDVLGPTGVKQSWAEQHPDPGEYAIAVLDTVRIMGAAIQGFTSNGSEYTLAGVFTGRSLPLALPNAGFWDGASDGTNNYAVDYNNGGVYRFDGFWGNPQLLFSTEPHYLGITYDQSNNTIWLSQWDTGVIEHRALNGEIISSFTIPFLNPSCLALDPIDGTLWMGSQLSLGTFSQFTQEGVPLNTRVYPTLANQNTLGGEFPATYPTPTPTPTPDPSATPGPTPTPGPKPRVTISVFPTTTREGTDATFTIAASSAVSQPLVVSFVMGGKAIEGTDYTLSAANHQVTIPIGSAAVTVTLHAIADPVTEKAEKVTATLQPNGAYTLPKKQGKKATTKITNAP